MLRVLRMGWQMLMRMRLCRCSTTVVGWEIDRLGLGLRHEGGSIRGRWCGGRSGRDRHEGRVGQMGAPHRFACRPWRIAIEVKIDVRRREELHRRREPAGTACSW
jgi:hypothetical protein